MSGIDQCPELARLGRADHRWICPFIGEAVMPTSRLKRLNDATRQSNHPPCRQERIQAAHAQSLASFGG
jgi:hypothetical protein